MDGVYADNAGAIVCPAALPAFFGTTPPSDSLSGDLPFSLYYRLSGILSFIERPDRISRVAVYSQCPTCHALGPRRGKIAQTIQHHFMVTSAGSRASSPALKLSRLNHFNIRGLRPVGSITLCLTFGITPASPRLSSRWLACLAGTGFSPVEINDLARPH